MDPTQPNQQPAGQQLPPPAPQALPPDTTPWSPTNFGAQIQPGPAGWAPGVNAYQLQPHNHRFRWAAALGLCLVVVLVTVAGAFVLSGAAGTNKALTAGYAPKDTVAFLDLRADLPGDQHQNLADFMSHFPGGKDRAQFDSAFDDILNKITGSISPDLTYTWALRGWTTGEVSVAVTGTGVNSSVNADMQAIMGAIASSLEAGPSALPAAGLPAAGPSQLGVLLVAVKDRAAGETWVSGEVTRTGVAFTPQDYAGTTLYVSAQTPPMAYAFTDKAFVAGDVASVKEALDAPSKGSLQDSSAYQAAMRSLSGDCIATFYLDPVALTKNVLPYGMGMGVGMALPSFSPGDFPAWVAGSVRAESNRIDVELKAPKAANAATTAGNRRSVLASELPGSTVGVMELHDIGPSINVQIKALEKSLPSASQDSVKQIEDALKLIGGLDWIGDGTFALTDVNGELGGGVLIKTPDATTATGKKAMITNLIALAGGQYGLGAKDENYKGTTVTVISIPPSVAGTGTSGAPIEIGIAAKGDVLVAGYGDGFAKAVIDTTADNSLASQADFKSVMSAVGDSNYMYMYWNFPATAGQIFATSMSSQYYELNYKPYVEHLGGAAFAAVDGNPVTLRLVITAK